MKKLLKKAVVLLSWVASAEGKDPCPHWTAEYKDFVAEVEAELSKPEAEPVAWKMTHPENNPCFIESYNQKEWGERWSAEPLYAHPPCSYAATRRAIVRAAADIGRSM